MNATLIADLEIIRDKLRHLADHADNITLQYEIVTAVDHVKKAIEWEKNRP